MNSVSNSTQEYFFPAAELWAPINGCSNYEVSTFGNVRSVRDGKIRPIKSSVSSNTYLNVRPINDEGKYLPSMVHRLVAMAFIPRQCAINDQVDHIDGNKFNNKVSNLRWVSGSVNSQHTYACPNGLARTRKVSILRDGLFQHFNSAAEAARFLNVSRQRIGYALTNRTEINGFRIMGAVKKSKAPVVPIVAIDLLGHRRTFKSIGEAVRETKSSQTGIHRVLKGKKLTTNGLKFVYAEVEAAQVA